MFLTEIYNEKSPFFSTDHRPKFQPAGYLPYSTESHLDQARYLCYVLVNLFLSIGSLDIQGLVGLSRAELLLEEGNHNSRQSSDNDNENDTLTVDVEMDEEEEEEGEEGEDNDDDIDYTELSETQTQTDNIGFTEFNASGKLTLKPRYYKRQLLD